MPNVINFSFLEILCYWDLNTTQIGTGAANKDLVGTLEQHLWCEGARHKEIHLCPRVQISQGVSVK